MKLTDKDLIRDLAAKLRASNRREDKLSKMLVRARRKS